MHEYTANLLCGTAEVDITPPEGVGLYGGTGRQRTSVWVLDPLYARVLVLRQGGATVCIITLDLLAMTREYSDRMRAHAESLGIHREAVLIHASHTHAAPSLGSIIYNETFPELPKTDAWIRGHDPAYGDLVVEGVATALQAALDDLEPVSMAHGRALEGRVSFNRRAVTREGHVTMPNNRWPNPLGHAEYLAYLEGPIDPEVAAVVFRTRDRKTKALLLHFSCHPVCVSSRDWYSSAQAVSADWPGAWCTGVRNLLGGSCFPIVLNGFSGNINPRDPFSPEPTDDHRAIGRRLTDTTEQLLHRACTADSGCVALQGYSRTVPIAFRDMDSKVLAAAEQRLDQYPTPQWTDYSRTTVDPAWGRAAGLLGIVREREAQALFNYEVQALRIGDIAVVGAMGEPFVEAQLAIKQQSPAQLTLMAHNVHHFGGYVPTREAFNYPAGRCGHEVNLSPWSKFEPDTLTKITQAAHDVLGDLFTT